MAKKPADASPKAGNGKASKKAGEDTPVSKLTQAAAKAELKRLGEEIRAADEAYYQEDSPHLTDADYDALRLRLKEIEETFPDLKRADSPSETVGAAATGPSGKVTHPKPML